MGNNCKINIVPLLLLPLLFLTVRCEEEKIDFYRDIMQAHDVWRLPIIEPYQVITADCCTGWNFQHINFKESFTVDSLNFHKNFIITFSGVNKWRLLDIKNKKIININTYEELIKFNNDNRLSIKMYSTEAVYNCWRETGQLPWAEEILNAQQCSARSKP